MSMLVRKGTMMHRTSSSRRNSRRNSSLSRPASERRDRAASLVPSSSASPTGATGAGTSKTPSPRSSRGSLPGPFPQTSGNTLAAPDNTEAESRRSSNTVSQISMDDRKRLYDDVERTGGVAATYGSIVYQMRDASSEARGCFDFAYRAIAILSNSIAMTLLLVSLSVLPLLMLIMGVKYLRDCPKEPNIPIYLLVGGCFGILKVLLMLWRQTRARRYERLDETFSDADMDDEATAACAQIMDVILLIFLLTWFGFGNYWIYRIYEPNYDRPLLAPYDWCDKTVYYFAIVQVLVTYGVMALLLLFVTFLVACHGVRTLVSGEFK